MKASLSEDLERWKARLARIGQAIEILSQNETFLRLKTLSRIGELDGETVARTAGCVENVEKLLRLYLALDAIVAKASDLAQSRNIFASEDRMAKASEILRLPVIADPTASRNFASLSLADAAGAKMSLADIFAKMESLFCGVRDAIAIAERGWAAASDLDARTLKLTAIGNEAAALGLAAPVELAAAQAAIARGKLEIPRNPIGAAAILETLDAMIAQAAATLSSAAADRAAAEAALAQARNRLDALSIKCQRANVVRLRRAAEILEPASDGPPPQDATQDISLWLARLNATFEAKRYRAVLVGLKSLSTSLESADVAISSALAADERLLAARDDLRARLFALKPRIETALGKLSQTAPERTAYAIATRELFGSATRLPQAVAALRHIERL